MALAEGKRTRDPVLSRILVARRINHYLGVQIWPGEVDDLPEDFLEAVNGLIDGVPKMKKHYDKVEGYLAKWRSGHPTYSKQV